MKETSFTVGLQNIAAEDVAKVVRIVEDTLASVVEAGFTPERIAAVLHSYELSLKHRSEIITNSSSVLGKCFFSFITAVQMTVPYLCILISSGNFLCLHY